MQDKAETWQNEVKRVITESQLIHLNRCATDILESRGAYEPQRNRAKEIKRMLKYINKGEDIKK